MNEAKIRKLRYKTEIVRQKVKLQGQIINLVNRRRQLEKIQLRGLNIIPFSMGGFIKRGNDISEDLFGVGRRARKRR